MFLLNCKTHIYHLRANAHPFTVYILQSFSKTMTTTEKYSKPLIYIDLVLITRRYTDINHWPFKVHLHENTGLRI